MDLKPSEDGRGLLCDAVIKIVTHAVLSPHEMHLSVWNCIIMVPCGHQDQRLENATTPGTVNMLLNVHRNHEAY